MSEQRERDWESMARERLEWTVASVTGRLRSIADQIDADAKFNIRNAAGRTTDYASYLQVAQAVVHEVSWGVANLNLGNVIDAAADAHNAQQEKIVQASKIPDPARVLAVMEQVVKSWAETAAQNEEALDRRDRKPSNEQPFVLSDILRMMDDVAREVGVTPVYIDLGEVNTDAGS